MELDEILFKNHLKSLNFGAVDVSFGWLLDDGNEILNWFYRNITNDNSLTPEEKIKISEIYDNNEVLYGENLTSELDDIFNTYDGLVCPQNKESLLKKEEELNDLQEILDLLQGQQTTREKLLIQDKEINMKISKEQIASREMLASERITYSDVIKECTEMVDISTKKKLKYYNMIEATLEKCIHSKENDKKLFFCEMPLELYFERTKLLETYLNLHISRQLGVTANTGVNSTKNYPPDVSSLNVYNIENENAVLIDMKLADISKKLEDALWLYIKYDYELCGILEKLKFRKNYDFDSYYDSRFETIKNIGSIEVLETEIEIILKQEFSPAISNFIKKKIEDVVLEEVEIKLEKFVEVHDRLCSTANMVQMALNENNFLLLCLKRDEHIVSNLYKFSMDAMNYLQADITACNARCFPFKPLVRREFFLESLFTLFEIHDTTRVTDVVDKIQLLQSNIAKMEKVVFQENFISTLDKLKDYKNASAPTKQIIWDGATKQPVICDTVLADGLHEIKDRNAKSEEKVQQLVKNFINFKKSIEKEGVLKKLWIWFLSEPHKITAFMREHEGKAPIVPFK